MAGSSFGARMAARGSKIAGSVAGYGSKMSRSGTSMKADAMSELINPLSTRNPFAQALKHKTGNSIMKTGNFVKNRPKTTMGIAAGVTGAGVAKRRRGSQNYPIQ